MTNSNQQPICIGIIEDNEDYAESLMLVLEELWQVKVLFHCDSIEAAVSNHAAQLALCQCVLLDINLPGMNGVEGISVVRMLCPDACAIIMLTLVEDRATIQGALRGGALGYLLKTDSIVRLAEQVVHAVESNFPALSPKVYRELATLASAAPTKPAPDAELTRREKDIYNGVVKGYDYKTIASELKVSTATVNFHMQNIFLKLGVRSKTELLSRHLQLTQ